METVQMMSQDTVNKLGALIPAQEAFFKAIKPLISELYEIITGDDSVTVTGEAPSVHSFFVALEALNSQNEMDQHEIIKEAVR